MEGARRVLELNDLGASTKPAPNLYPHQWNWDSCFMSIGIGRYDTGRAVQEIRSLLRGQWRNGMVPQIVFNPKGTGYFPGPEVWQCERSPDAPRGVQTSGITQPPVLASACLRIWDEADGEDKDEALAFLSDVYPSLVRYHRFLYEERDPDGTGLIVVVHPWESGLDNSPPYLDAGQRVHMAYKPRYTRLDTLHVSAKNRPTDKDYDLFVFLLEQMRQVNWNQTHYLKIAPLQVEDVLFSSVLCRAGADLAEIATLTGNDPSQALEWRDRTVCGINGKLWDDRRGSYYSFDRVAGHLLLDDTVAGFHTLYAGAAPSDRAERMVVSHLRDAATYWPRGGFPLPTTAINSPWFNPENYWLGPTWINTNWMVMHGLRDYGYTTEVEQLAETSLRLVERAGFREYFNPFTGAGYGTDDFGWTAALSLDLAAERSRA